MTDSLLVFQSRITNCPQSPVVFALFCGPLVLPPQCSGCVLTLFVELSPFPGFCPSRLGRLVIFGKIHPGQSFPVVLALCSRHNALVSRMISKRRRIGLAERDLVGIEKGLGAFVFD